MSKIQLTPKISSSKISSAVSSSDKVESTETESDTKRIKQFINLKINILR